jgi:hypothetical protein
MKRLLFFMLLIVLVATFAAFPVQVAAKNSTPQTETILVAGESQGTEKSELSLADCPVWAQMLVVGVVALFGWLAVVPLLRMPEEGSKRSERGAGSNECAEGRAVAGTGL